MTTPKMAYGREVIALKSKDDLFSGCSCGEVMIVIMDMITAFLAI